METKKLMRNSIFSGIMGFMAVIYASFNVSFSNIQRAIIIFSTLLFLMVFIIFLGKYNEYKNKKTTN